MSWKRSIITSLMIVLVSLSSSTAFAQDEDDEVDHFEKGAALYFKGEYGAAIVQFKLAYRDNPNGLILYNMALCYAKLGNYIEAYKISQEASESEDLSEKQLSRNAGRGVGFARRIIAEKTAGKIARKKGIKVTGPGPSVTVINKPQPVLAWTGLGFGIIGTGVLVGALGLNISVNNALTEYQNNPPPTYEERIPVQKQINDQRATGRTLVFVGIPLLAVGVTLLSIDTFILAPERDKDTRKDENTQLFIAPLSNGASVQFHTTF